MNNEYFFQWNVPADNHYLGLPDSFINVVAKLFELPFGNDVFVHPVITSNHDLRTVKDWNKAISEMEAIARKHFGEEDAPVIGELTVNEVNAFV